MDGDAVAERVRSFYQRHPYPPPVDDLDEYRRRWQDPQRRRADHHLFWPARPYREDPSILIAGCGTSQAARHAMRWPRARVTGIDFSDTSLRSTEALKAKYDLANLTVRELSVERAGELGATFDQIICTGVLHHLPDPASGAAAVASVVRDGGRLVYWVYGRENNEWITRFVDPVRRSLTSKIPSEPLRALSAVPAAAIWAAIKLLYRPGPDGSGPRHLPYGQYFASMYTFPFDELLSIVFDQLVTPVAYYLPRAEVEAWFQGPGFEDVSLRWHNEMSWTATATVVRAAATGGGSAESPARSVG